MLKFMRNIDIQVFLRFGSFSPGFWTIQEVAYIRIA